MNRWIRYYLPSCLWALLIFVVSSLSIGVPGAEFRFVDKLYHVVEYAVFAFLLARSFKYVNKPFFKSNFVLLAVIVGSLYGLSDEFHQIFIPLRSFDIFDIAADAFGSLFGAFFYYLKAR